MFMNDASIEKALEAIEKDREAFKKDLEAIKPVYVFSESSEELDEPDDGR